MDLRAVRKLIAKGEGSSIEFKKKANHPEKIIREVVAFANTNGGHLFIGVSDDGTLSGIKYPEEELYVLNKAIEELCRPTVDYSVESIEFEEGSYVLHYKIEAGEQKPYFAFLKKEHRYGKAFFRVEDRSIQASRELRRILKDRRKHNVPFHYEESTGKLFNYFKKNKFITISQYCELSGLNKKLASKKLVSLALSGALKIEPKEGEDLFLPVM